MDKSLRGVTIDSAGDFKNLTHIYHIYMYIFTFRGRMIPPDLVCAECSGLIKHAVKFICCQQVLGKHVGKMCKYGST